MNFDNSVLNYLINFIGGVLIGIPILGQLIINAGLGKVEYDDSRKQRVLKTSLRLFFLLISFLVISIVMYIIRSCTTISVIGAIVLATASLSTIFFGRRLLMPKEASKPSPH